MPNENQARFAGVLKLAAEKAGWDGKLAKGKGRGVAVHKSFGSYVAEVMDVTVNADGAIAIDKVTCAVDCGLAVNPDVIRAQMEGGFGYLASHRLGLRWQKPFMQLPESESPACQ